MNRKRKRRKHPYAKLRCSDHIHVPARVTGRNQSHCIRHDAGCFAVRGIKIVEGGKDGLFVSMPSRKTQDGYKDICFPVTAEFRKELHQAVLGAYEQALTMAQTAAPQTAAPQEEQAGPQMAGL